MHLYVDLGKHFITVMALVGFSASAVQALTYQNGDYIGSLNKKASGAQCFIMALGLFWDIVTGLPWTPNGVGFLEPRGYCIFLPGAHYLTINSPYGADSSLNILLLLLLLTRLFVRLYALSLVCSLVRVFALSIVYSFNFVSFLNQLVCSYIFLNYSFVGSCVCRFVIRSFIRVFVNFTRC